jgi:hypothetical protein
MMVIGTPAVIRPGPLMKMILDLLKLAVVRIKRYILLIFLSLATMRFMSGGPAMLSVRKIRPTHFFSNGPSTVRVNQQQDPGRWNLLATGFFEPGAHQIVVSDDASGAVVVVDAIRIISTQKIDCTFSSAF